jgi:hypothetical protein
MQAIAPLALHHIMDHRRIKRDSLRESKEIHSRSSSIRTPFRFFEFKSSNPQYYTGFTNTVRDEKKGSLGISIAE